MTDFLTPEWPAPAGVRAAVSLRGGGVSTGACASLNLGDHVGDDPARVAENRARLVGRLQLPAEPRWLRQVHGVTVAPLDAADTPPEADAAWTARAGTVCAILTADCLPVLFCDRAGSVVAAAHAGWRGLVAGVLEHTVRALPVKPSQLLAWLGPAIGPQAFEVGAEVRAVFVQAEPQAAADFQPSAPGKYRADLYALARRRLHGCGVEAVYGGGLCTHSDAARFYSHRRDARSGRMASLIWLQ